MMKKNFALGLLAVAVLLVPTAITTTTYASSEKAAMSVETQCTMVVTKTVYFANGTPDAEYFFIEGDYSGDLPLYSWDPTTYMATYRGPLYHYTCR